MSFFGDERRKYQRFQVREPLQFQENQNDAQEGGITYDISEGGVRFHSNGFIPLDTQLNVNVQLKTNESVKFRGRVVWVQMVPHSDRYQIGFQFDEAESMSNPKEVMQNYFTSHP